MEVKFIGQGLSRPSDRPASNVINKVLENSDYKEFSAFVAFKIDPPQSKEVH